jgi:hypothetical protein
MPRDGFQDGKLSLGNPVLLLMLLFLGTFDVHRRDWRALLRRMRLLRLGNKRQKIQVLRVKWQKRRELRKMEQYNPPLSARPI